MQWRVLLGVGAVPHMLSAAAITVYGHEAPTAVVPVANELLDLWELLTKWGGR
ncbi:hypothetical protein ABTX85_10950 [Streptomyces sp. NPDC096097]|uniref:hypothetical protein n=1 Tax=Streptomyces sp. NPDC096097 TaxID=3155546 RepID=UPI003326829C